jgi:hypothetical protein
MTRHVRFGTCKWFLQCAVVGLSIVICTARNEKSDNCAVCHALVKELKIELAKTANSTEIIELARFDLSPFFSSLILILHISLDLSF